MRNQGGMRAPAIAILGLTATVVLLFGAREPILLALGNFLVVHDPLRPADLIHVIAGEDNRTDYALQLYGQGYGKRIFFTGGWCDLHGYYHGQHGVARAESQGIPLGNIVVDESTVTSTYDEAIRVKELVARSPAPIRSVIVVSDPFHMRRVQWSYRNVLGKEVELLVAPVPFAQSPYELRWWLDAASERYVKDEYLKLVYYYARYRLGRGPVQRWLASLDTE